MRILVAHNVGRARTGGMSRIMGFIHDRVAEAGHEVEYLCAEDLPAQHRGRRARFAFPFLVRRRAVEAARSGRPFDIVNVHEPQAAVIGHWRRAAGNPRVVVTSHGVERRSWELALEERRLGRGGPSLRSRIIYPLTGLWQSTLGLRGADHIFCLNYEDRDYLMRWLSLPSEHITRIYPGADPMFARAAADRDSSQARRILFAGTWRKNKGIQDLVPAFYELAMRYPSLRLAVLGGLEPPEVIRAAFPEAVRAQVECIRAQTEQETAAAFATADLFVLPSLFEGTPLTLMEGMMSGLPVVATATCGMKDVIRDGENGLLVPIRSPEAIVSAVERLVHGPDLRARLGRAAQQEALTMFSWERAAQPVLEAYEHLHGRKVS